MRNKIMVFCRLYIIYYFVWEFFWCWEYFVLTKECRSTKENPWQNFKIVIYIDFRKTEDQTKWLSMLLTVTKLCVNIALWSHVMSAKLATIKRQTNEQWNLDQMLCLLLVELYNATATTENKSAFPQNVNYRIAAQSRNCASSSTIKKS